MELSELSLRVEKLEEIIQKLAKWTNFNLNTKEEGSLDNIGETPRQNKNKNPLRFANVAKSMPEISNGVEEDAEDPSISSVVIKMELEEEEEQFMESCLKSAYNCEQATNNIEEVLPENNVEWNDNLSNYSEHSESASDFAGLAETGPPKKRRKRSADKKYEPLKVPKKSSLSPSEPFVSLRPLTPSQLPSKNNQKSNDLKCPSCPRKFKTKIAFSIHVRSGICQRGARPFACPHCPYAAATKGTLSTHIQSKHPNEEERCHRTFTCPECPETFRFKQKLSKHIAEIHIEKHHKHHCYFCPWKGKRLDKLTTHLRIHTREKPYKCPHCVYTSWKGNSEVQRHMKAFHSVGERSHQCPEPECPCKFKSQTLLEKHQRVYHNAGYKCGICEFVGSNYVSLKEHLNCHKTEDGMFQCPHCPKTYKEKKSMVIHVRVHTGEKPYKCEKCSNAYRDENHLRQHEITCQNKGHRPFACPHCQFAARGRSELSYHIKTVHPATEEERLQRPFKCPECSKAFRFKKNLTRHTISMHNTKTFLCDSCPYLASNYNAFRQHINNKHEEIRFFCYFCPWKDRRLYKLTSHLRTHTGEKPYKCPHCIYSSSQEKPLKKHVKFLHGQEEGSFQCPKCPSRFKAQWVLAKHLKIHDGTAYKCGICGFEAFNDASLKKHQKDHKTEDGQFQCPHCSKTCRRRTELTFHIRTHTGEKPYKCGKCEYTSARKDRIRIHGRICKGYRKGKSGKKKDLKDEEELPEQNATAAPTTSAQDEGNY